MDQMTGALDKRGGEREGALIHQLTREASKGALTAERVHTRLAETVPRCRR